MSSPVQYDGDIGFTIGTPPADPPDPPRDPMEMFQEKREENFNSSTSPVQFYDGEIGFSMGSPPSDQPVCSFENFQEKRAENFSSPNSPLQFNDDLGFIIGSPAADQSESFQKFNEKRDKNFSSSNSTLQYDDDLGFTMGPPQADQPVGPFEIFQEERERFTSSSSPMQFSVDYGFTMGSTPSYLPEDSPVNHFENFEEKREENFNSSTSPMHYNDDYGFTMGPPPPDPPVDHFQKFQEKREQNFNSTLAEGDNGMVFDEYIDSLDLPPDLNGLEQERTYGPETQEPEKSLQDLLGEMYVGQEDVPEIQQEEAILKLAMPPQPKGTPLKGYPFILKLYLAASSDAIPMINWSPNGLQLMVDYQFLQHHLITGSVIFSCRNVLQFTEKLMTEGFVRIYEKVFQAGLEAADLRPMWLYYQKEKFVRGDLDGLKKLMDESLLKEKYSPSGRIAEKAERQPEFPVPLHLPSKSHIERMQQRGDKCCASISLRAPIQVARCRLRTLLDHLAATKILEASAHLNDNTSMKKGRPLDFPTFTSSSIKFVRPHDSVITLDPNKPLPEYAGYYGRVSPSKVSKFFSDYLPRYGNKTTGYKDIVLETTNKPSNFQQNLPIGVEYSDSDDNEPFDVQPPASPAGQDSDMDCMPSTSAAAAAAMRTSGRKGSVDSVDDHDLEEAMQELCGGSTALKENLFSGSRGKAKAQPQPKSPKATSRKRRAKSFDSTSSEDEAGVSRKPKRARKETFKDARKVLESTPEEAIEDFPEVPPKKRGPKAKAKTPKPAPRKRLASPNKDEVSPPRKRARKGVQDSKKTKKNKQPEELEEEVLVKKKRVQKKKQLPETDEESDYEDFGQNETKYFEGNDDEYFEENENEYVEVNEQVLQDEVENANADEYLQEEIDEEDVYLDDMVEGSEYLDEDIPEGDEQPVEHHSAEDGDDEYYPEKGHSDEEHPEEDVEEHPEENEDHFEENLEEHPEEENEAEHSEVEEFPEEDEQPEDDINADQTQRNEVDNEENSDAEEDIEEELDTDEDEDVDEETDEEDDAEDNDDTDDDDYSVQYRAAALQPDKPRRYDLRNSMRKSN